MQMSSLRFSGYIPRHGLHELVHDLPNKLTPTPPRARKRVSSSEFKKALAADENSTSAQRSLAPFFVHYRRGLVALNTLGEAASVMVALPFAAVGAVLYGTLGAPLAVLEGFNRRSAGRSVLQNIGQEWRSIALQGLTLAAPPYLACKLGSLLLVTPLAAAVGILLHALGERTGLNESLRRMTQEQVAQDQLRKPAPPPQTLETAFC